MKLLNAVRGDGLRAKALRSSWLTLLNFGGEQALRLAANLVLTRLLFPEAFGIMALAMVVITGAGMFSDIGIRGSIVQDERGEDPAFLNTAWTIQILRGALLWLIITFLAAPMANFYDEPLLADILMVIAVIPFIDGFLSTRMASASRHLTIGRLTAISLGSQCVGIVIMIALAFWLQSVWALAIGSLASPSIRLLLSHVLLPGHRDRIGFEKDAFRRLFNFGKYIFVATVAGFFINQGDKAILGKFVALDTLAIYNIAYFLAAVPLLLGLKMNHSVIFPLYARRPPAESEDNRHKINRSRFMVTGVLLSTAFVLALIGNDLIVVMYDPRYEGAGPLMVLIAVAIMPQLITLSYANLPLSVGDSGRFAVLLTVVALVQVATLYLGAKHYGVLGAIFAPTVSYTLTYPFMAMLVRRYKGVDPRHDAAFAGVALVMAAIVFWLHQNTLTPLFSAL